MFPFAPLPGPALWKAWADLSIASQAVIALRLMPYVGLAPMSRTEAVRMVAEKAPALTEAALTSQTAIWRGAGIEAATLAGLRPLTRRARGNRTRLLEHR